MERDLGARRDGRDGDGGDGGASMSYGPKVKVGSVI